MYFTQIIMVMSKIDFYINIIIHIVFNHLIINYKVYIQGVQASCGRRPDSHTSGTTQPRAKVDTPLGTPTWAPRTPIRTNSLQHDFWEIFLKN